MKGVSSGTGIIIAAALIVIGLVSVWGLFASTQQVSVPKTKIDYDGEFDDAFLATKGSFYSDFTEFRDCNVTSDVLGGSSYSSCIYRSGSPINGSGFLTNGEGGQNSTDFQLNLVFDVDGPLEELDVEVKPQTSSTCQPNDDMIIKTAEIWIHDDEETKPVWVLSVEDTNEIDTTIERINEGDEYVLSLLFHTKTIQPNCAAGDDLFKIDLDAKTDGDTDSARILIESS